MSKDGSEEAGSDENEDEVDDGQAVRFRREDILPPIPVVPSVDSLYELVLMEKRELWVTYFLWLSFLLCVLTCVLWMDWTIWLVIFDPTPTCQAVGVRGDPRLPSTDLGNTPGPSGGIPGQQPAQVVWQGGITVTEPVSVDRF